MKHSPRTLSAALLWALAPATLGLGGCNLQRLAADQTAEIAEAGSSGFNGFWDYDIFGKAIPSAIVQSEALIRVSPKNEKMLLGLARTYVVYAYGWLGDEWERADDQGDFERADELERRIFQIYKRSAELALKVVRWHDKGGKLDEMLKSGKVEVLKPYLAENFTKQEDVSALYYAGLAWGSMMANSGGDLKILADAPLAFAILERSVELDPSYAAAGGLAVMGTVEASFPELFGGNLEKAKGYYERSLQICKRQNHLVLLSYAKTYAVAKQDRELFLRLLHEILSAPDQGDELRMNNKVARHRAKRYLKRVDDWFPPPLAATPPEEPATAPTP